MTNVIMTQIRHSCVRVCVHYSRSIRPHSTRVKNAVCTLRLLNLLCRETHCAVRPVGVIKCEVLGCVFGLFGVDNTCNTNS